VEPRTRCLSTSRRAALTRAIEVAEQVAAGGQVIDEFDGAEFEAQATDTSQLASAALATARHAAAAARIVTGGGRAYFDADHLYEAGCAYASALEAAGPDDREAFVKAAGADLETLRRLDPDPDGRPGQPVDSSPSGLLGPWWPETMPGWFLEDRARGERET